MSKKHYLLRDPLKTWPTTSMLIFSLLGIILSVYLWSFSLSDTPIPCTVDGGCESVLRGEWSELFDIPIAALGTAFYSAFFYTSILKLFIRHSLLDWSQTVLITSGILFTTYLRYLEISQIGYICQWCWVSMILVIILFVAYLYDEKYLW